MSVDNMPKPESQAPPSGLKKVVGASMAGTVVEWYEFFLYGTAATLVFSKVFFPGGGNELDAIIALSSPTPSDSPPGHSAESSSDISETSSAGSSCCSSVCCWSVPRPS